MKITGKSSLFFVVLLFALLVAMTPRENRRKTALHSGIGISREDTASGYRLAVPADARPARPFPANFMWGIATSAFQDEGGGGKTDWDKVLSAERKPPVFGGFTDADVLLAKEYGVNCIRDSIEWGRVEPAPGVWDEKELDHAFQRFRFMVKNRVCAIVNLNHFALPSWASEMGGWENDGLPALYAAYARKVALKFKPLGIERWMTFNEIMPFVEAAYVGGNYTPFKKDDFEGAMAARRNIIRAHHLAYRVLHETLDTRRKKVEIGVAHLVDSYQPADPNSKKDREATEQLEFAMNFNLIDALDDSLDYIGLNYYSGWRIKFNAFSFFFGAPVQYLNIGRDEDRYYPEGIYRNVKQFARYHKPIIITENGVNDADDAQRPAFIVSHLYWLQKAASEAPADAPVIGYFYWTLLDNFEWLTKGPSHTGLFRVDPVTKERSPRPSAFLFRDIAAANGLTPDMLARAR